MEEFLKNLKKIKTKKDEEEGEGEGEDGIEECEPVSPAGRVFRGRLNCHVICLFGCKQKIDIQDFKKNVENSPLFKHKRFSSIVKEDKKGKLRWVPTKTNIDDHIIVPEIDLTTDNSLDFVENYAAKLATAPPLDPSKPLWQFHVVNTKSAEAEATMILRIHHSLGDGISLISLCFASSRKANDPTSLPTLPRPAQKPTRQTNLVYLIFILFARFFLMMYYTFQDFVVLVGILSEIVKDSNTPIKGSGDVGSMPKRLAHVSFSLEDVKTIKQAVNATINDVILGTLVAGLVRYLDRIYASREETLPSNLNVRILIPVNMRASPGIQELADMESKNGQCRWGNDLGYFIISLPMIKYEDPLHYARDAKIICDKKKSSLGVYTIKLIAHLPDKMAEDTYFKVAYNTTLTFSNTVAPQEEVDLFGQRITYIAPTSVGHPQSLMVHLMSYMGKVRLVVTSAENFMPDPERLCFDFLESLGHMKQAAAAKINGLARKNDQMEDAKIIHICTK